MEMVTHGGIGSYGRMIMYLKCSNNSKSLTIIYYIIVFLKQFKFIGFFHVLDVIKDVKTDWLPNICLKIVG